jgi:hypothetical protein
MRRWLADLDRLLRGEATRPSALRAGTIAVSGRGLAVIAVALGLTYGFCMGWFALFNHKAPNYEQMLASTVKVPALFLLTLLVTCPSLYVFNALVGSRLTLHAMLRLLVAAMAVMLAVLASFGPIVAFFSVTTSSYSFMTLLNVVMFSVAGLLGLVFLLQTLHRLSIVDLNAWWSRASGQQGPGGGLPAGPEPAGGPGGTTGDAGPQTGGAEPVVKARLADVPAPPAIAPPAMPNMTPDLGALDRLEGRILGPHVKAVFRCWVVVFALVGSQMAWVLRPFIGNPNQPFTWFRPRSSNFFMAVAQSFLNLIGVHQP